MRGELVPALLLAVFWRNPATAFQSILPTVLPSLFDVGGSSRLLSCKNAANSSTRNTSKPKPNPYTVLGLPHDATIEQVKSSYHKLAKAYHPDANPEEERSKNSVLFQTIQEAYKVVLSQARQLRREEQSTLGRQSAETAYIERDPRSSSYRRAHRPTRPIMTTPSDSNSPHRDWPEPHPGDWSTTTTLHHRSSVGRARVSHPGATYVTARPPNSNIHKHFQTTGNPQVPPPRRGPSWSRPQPQARHGKGDGEVADDCESTGAPYVESPSHQPPRSNDAVPSPPTQSVATPLPTEPHSTNDVTATRAQEPRSSKNRWNQQRYASIGPPLQANGVDGEVWNLHPYAKSPSSRPRSSIRQQHIVKPMAKQPPIATQQRRRPATQQERSTTSSEDDSSTRNTQHGPAASAQQRPPTTTRPKSCSSSHRRNQQRPRQYYNEDYFANDSTGQNSPYSLHKKPFDVVTGRCSTP